MEVVYSVALGVVFVLAGASKVARGREWPAQAAGLGTPHPVAAALPWWELVIGALLISGIALPWAAIAAAVTLVLFTGAIVRVLRRGERPPCACFGGWSTQPLGWHHVARNAVFLAIAIAAIVVSR